MWVMDIVLHAVQLSAVLCQGLSFVKTASAFWPGQRWALIQLVFRKGVSATEAALMAASLLLLCALSFRL